MKRSIISVAFLGLALCVVLFALGCEDKPDTDGAGGFFADDITADTTIPTTVSALTPDQGVLEIGPSGAITLGVNGDTTEITLSGAAGDVTWNVANGSRGELISKSNVGATYRRLAAGDNVVSATDSAGRTVAKVIKQTLGNLAITPSGEIKLFTNGNTVELTLTGAQGNVTWSVALPGIGTLTAQSNTGATYRRDAGGTNVITAVDGALRTIEKEIKQP